MNNKLELIQTAKNTADRMSEKEGLYLSSFENLNQTIIAIDESQEYQVIEGFGGAFTEAAADTFYKMSSQKREEILEAYFDPQKGINYSLCRTHINSCDFSLGNYSYAEIEGDADLKFFNIGRDYNLLIPMIKEAMGVNGSKIKFLASPWSPPYWMKTNGEMNHGGKLKEKYRESWARYFVKYIKAYRREGIDIWGVSVQNEPDAVQTWDSCIYSHEEERDFVRDYLGPIFAEEALGNINIIVWDHNTDQVFERAKVILEDEECAKYVWGVGFHWYSGDQFENLAKTHAAFPDKKLLFTEGCQEGGVHLDSWSVGERYGHNMINDFNNWTVGWIDWNMVLNETGGPNHVGNYCDAPIIANTNTDEIHYENSYYYIGHFSKYIEPGATRIGCSCSGCDKLETTAFKNSDGTLVIVVMNSNDYEVDYCIKIGDRGTSIKALAHSIVTLIK
ncbi:MAG TPA: glycoside hydrolase family 30 protein [Clostridia bacterium]|nr:glycoside hydrolase family 30 protein [Clostridia bacterium]